MFNQLREISVGMGRLNENIVVDVAFMVFQKAFDKMLQKLKHRA